jgi:hypothetical protein
MPFGSDLTFLNTSCRIAWRFSYAELCESKTIDFSTMPKTQMR